MLFNKSVLALSIAVYTSGTSGTCGVPAVITPGFVDIAMDASWDVERQEHGGSYCGDENTLATIKSNFYFDYIPDYIRINNGIPSTADNDAWYYVVESCKGNIIDKVAESNTRKSNIITVLTNWVNSETFDKYTYKCSKFKF